MLTLLGIDAVLFVVARLGPRRELAQAQRAAVPGGRVVARVEEKPSGDLYDRLPDNRRARPPPPYAREPIHPFEGGVKASDYRGSSLSTRQCYKRIVEVQFSRGPPHQVKHPIVEGRHVGQYPGQTLGRSVLGHSGDKGPNLISTALVPQAPGRRADRPGRHTAKVDWRNPCRQERSKKRLSQRRPDIARVQWADQHTGIQNVHCYTSS